MEFTTEEIVANGVQIIEEVAREKKLKFEKYLVLENYDEIIPDNINGKSKEMLNYFLNKPWETPIMKGI